MSERDLAEVVSLGELRARRAGRSATAQDAVSPVPVEPTAHAPATAADVPLASKGSASDGASPVWGSAWTSPELRADSPEAPGRPERAPSSNPSEAMLDAWGQGSRRAEPTSSHGPSPVCGAGPLRDSAPDPEQAPARPSAPSPEPMPPSTPAPDAPAEVVSLAELARRRRAASAVGSETASGASPGFAAAWTAPPATPARGADAPSAAPADSRRRAESSPVVDEAPQSAEARLARAAEAVEHAEAVERAVEAAEERALAMLRRTDRSSGELRRALAQDELLGEAEIERILERLGELGYLDDARLAEHLVEKHLVRQGKGRMAVERLLRDKGIPPEAIDAALAEHDRDDEFERARETAIDRARKLRGLDEETATRRLVSFLQRRGFTSGVAYRAAQDALRMPSGRASGGSSSGVRFVPSDAID